MTTENDSFHPSLPQDGPPARQRSRRMPPTTGAQGSDHPATEEMGSLPIQESSSRGNGPILRQDEEGRDRVAREANFTASQSASLPNTLHERGSVTINATGGVVIRQVAGDVLFFPATPSAQDAAS